MFPTQNFSEIVFCAVSSNEQVKVLIRLAYIAFPENKYNFVKILKDR